MCRMSPFLRDKVNAKCRADETRSRHGYGRAMGGPRVHWMGERVWVNGVPPLYRA